MERKSDVVLSIGVLIGGNGEFFDVSQADIEVGNESVPSNLSIDIATDIYQIISWLFIASMSACVQVFRHRFIDVV
jgi:hypothetical protein